MEATFKGDQDFYGVVETMMMMNDIWGCVQIKKLLSVQLSPFSCYVMRLRSKYSSQNAVSQTHSAHAVPLMLRDQVSHPYKTTGRIMIFYVLTFTFLDSRREDKIL
jgi:hypothetical protein